MSFTNVPQLSRKDAFLDSGDMVKNPVQVFEKYRATLGPTFAFHFGGVKKTLVSSDPHFIQHILKDNQRNYRKSDIQVKRMAEFQGTGLLNSHDDFWLRQRRLLSQGFSKNYLPNLLPLQMEVMREFLNGFGKAATSGPIDMYRQMVNLTLRLVGKSLFGDSMQDSHLEEIGLAISEIQAFMVRQIVQPYKIPWFRISGQTGQYQKIRRAADDVILNYVQERKRKTSDHQDLLQLLLTTPYKDTGELMSSDQVAIEILQLLVAGNETSSNTLAWTFYTLAKNPEYISQMRNEINATFGDKSINMDGLYKLECSIRILYEVMRLYPAFWMIDRVAVHDDEVCGINIPAGVTVVPYIYGVHHNEDFWPEAFHFNPDRFKREEMLGRHPFVHIPFGGGPRVCIGQNMALMQLLLIMTTIIREYDFKLATTKTVDINPMMILRPDGPVMLNFCPVPGASM